MQKVTLTFLVERRGCSHSPRTILSTRPFPNRHAHGPVALHFLFGGARMSGIGSKADGPDYLLQFVIPRAICESTIRQGFAPMG